MRNWELDKCEIWELHFFYKAAVSLSAIASVNNVILTSDRSAIFILILYLVFRYGKNSNLLAGCFDYYFFT